MLAAILLALTFPTCDPGRANEWDINLPLAWASGQSCSSLPDGLKETILDPCVHPQVEDQPQWACVNIWGQAYCEAHTGVFIEGVEVMYKQTIAVKQVTVRLGDLCTWRYGTP